MAEKKSSKRMLFGVAAALVVPIGLVGWSMLPSDAAAAPVAGGTYQVAVKKSGLCIDVPGASKDNGALLQQWGCSAGAGWQQFKLVAAGSNFLIQNVSSGKCADVPAGSKTSGQRVQQYTCVGSQTNQQWRITASGTGTFQVINVNSGLCLSDQGASTASGAAIIQETCTANSNKQWAFTPVTGATPPPAGSFTVAADGSGTYKTVQAAIDAVGAGNASRKTITIKPGTYRETLSVPSTKPYVTLQGGGDSADDVVIVNDRPASTYGTNGSATAHIVGHDFAATNLTISNDYDETKGNSQALAVALESDRSVFSKVRLLGDQDTLLVNNSARAYFTGSYVEGTVDFIYGGGIAVFNASTIHEKRSSGGPITAASTPATQAYGFLIYKSTITGATANSTQFGRPWRQDAQVLIRESNLSATMATAQPWVDMSGSTWQNARFLEYKNTGAGATKNGNRPQLSDAQAATYTPQKYLAGSDNWNPVG
ncbi:pectinesterase family protein [Actinoplanes sp. NPDC051494]|uniref:pectinesterase family protein n=1 Tax=Actinoplanes sp. NPDC051494 TaxID=3363907 RepID=UPI0037ADD910